MNVRIDRRNPDFKSERYRTLFELCRAVAPSAVWHQILGECDCCDPDEEESPVPAHRCSLTELEFGPRWGFSIAEHQHVVGKLFRVDLDVFHNGEFMESHSFLDCRTGGRHGNGRLSQYCLAENKLMEVLGVPVPPEFAEVRAA